MKAKTLFIALLCCCAATVSCQESEEQEIEFSVSESALAFSAEGGGQTIHLQAGDGWVATTDSPWIEISPVNGFGSADLVVEADTTIVSGESREGVVRVVSKNNSDRMLTVNVSQAGYEPFITVSQSSVDVPSQGNYGERSFTLDVTANVEFEAVLETESEWITMNDYDFSLDRGARPRKTRITFNWSDNPHQEIRNAILNIKAKADESVSSEPVSIVQAAAAEIEDSRKGDSLAVVACAESLNFDMDSYLGKKMDYWDFLDLWDPDDEGWTEDKDGRVREVLFSYISTDDGVPYEIRYLRKAEAIRFYSNVNAFLKNFSTGPYIAELTQLKYVQFFAFGLSEIDEDFANLKNLETLDIRSNNFNEFPDVLTPENFPNLTSLDASSCRRRVVFNMAETTVDYDLWGGFRGEFPTRLLYWDKLETLGLSYNYIYGTLPDMKDHPNVYTEEDIRASNDTLPAGNNNPAGYSIIGKPKVLPNTTALKINLNALHGEIPEWILYHPHLDLWIPESFIWSQDGEVYDLEGNRSGFTNTPEDLDYYYEAYPLKEKSQSEFNR